MDLMGESFPFFRRKRGPSSTDRGLHLPESSTNACLRPWVLTRLAFWHVYFSNTATTYFFDISCKQASWKTDSLVIITSTQTQHSQCLALEILSGVMAKRPDQLPRPGQRTLALERSLAIRTAVASSLLAECSARESESTSKLKGPIPSSLIPSQSKKKSSVEKNTTCPLKLSKTNSSRLWKDFWTALEDPSTLAGLRMRMQMRAHALSLFQISLESLISGP